MKNIKLTIAALLLIGLASSCTAIKGFTKSSTKETQLTGLFGNNSQKMQSAFDNIPKNMTKEEVVAMGFDPDSKNVQKLPGASGSKYMFGTDQVRPSIDDPTQYKNHILELERYDTWIFPYVNTSNNSDQNLISSKKKSHKTGSEKYYIIVFYDQKVLTKYVAGANTDVSKESTSSALKGVFGTLMDLGSMGRRFR